MDNNTFSNDFKKYLKWICILFLIIIALPILLTKFPICFSDFSKTGPIGDTIGGIMGPFVAIAAALLTFLAFWVQFKANEQLKDDIALERFESKFYKLLDLHIQNTNNLSIHGIHGREVFKYLVDSLFFIYNNVEAIYNNYSTQQKSLSNIEREMLTRISYGFFFYGTNYIYLSNSKEESNLYKKVKNNFSDINSKYSYDISKGYNVFLGHYYRNLFQIVEFVANYNNKLISEKQKYEYVKMLRAQLSDYEQIMLYYNSISDIGRNWNNISNQDSDIPQQKMGYIARFKLIKNIPFDSLVGLWPNLKYEKEIKIYQKLEERFFEHDLIKCSL